MMASPTKVPAFRTIPRSVAVVIVLCAIQIGLLLFVATLEATTHGLEPGLLASKLVAAVVLTVLLVRLSPWRAWARRLLILVEAVLVWVLFPPLPTLYQVYLFVSSFVVVVLLVGAPARRWSSGRTH
jgi:hypothetical protein